MFSEIERSERWISLDEEGGESACWMHMVEEETSTVRESGRSQRAHETIVPERDNKSRSIHLRPSSKALTPGESSRIDMSHPERQTASD